MIPSEQHDIGFAVLYALTTNLIGDEHFIWFELKRKPLLSELRKLKQVVEVASREARLFANVDSENETNMRFAQSMGFKEVRRAGTVAVMVLGDC